MSFRGITFKNQEVRPEDDGRLYAAIFTDGVLYGCSFTSAGYTLTMSPGYLLACGRLLKLGAVQNFALAGASEGYARLLLRVNLNLPATETGFEQAQAVVEYAMSETGFSEVQQPDLNSGGAAIYELPLAVCSLSGSGITKIVWAVGPAEFREGDE